MDEYDRGERDIRSTAAGRVSRIVGISARCRLQLSRAWGTNQSRDAQGIHAGTEVRRAFADLRGVNRRCVPLERPVLVNDFSDENWEELNCRGQGDEWPTSSTSAVCSDSGVNWKAGDN